MSDCHLYDEIFGELPPSPSMTTAGRFEQYHEGVFETVVVTRMIAPSESDALVPAALVATVRVRSLERALLAGGGQRAGERKTHAAQPARRLPDGRPALRAGGRAQAPSAPDR